MDKKISQLVAAGPLTGSELLPLVQSGVTKQTTLSDIQEAQSVTYAEAMSLIGTSGLTPGKTYLLSDFQTKHYIVDSFGNQDLGTIITGATEPLILTAASTSEFSPVASSTTFPQDIIHIDLNPNNWLFDLSFADVYGTGNIVPGFKGVIFYREDTKNNNIFNFDFRNCKSRRWKVIPNNWNSATTYNQGDIVVSNDVLYYATKSNTNEFPPSGIGSWMEILDLSLTRYISSYDGSFSGCMNVGMVCIPVDPNDYQDFKMFVENGPTGTYEASVFGNKFGLTFKDQDNFYEWFATLLPNNVIHLTDYGYYNLYGNRFEGLFYYNTFIAPEYFVQNTFLQECITNIIYGKSGFHNNLISGRFNNNSVNGDFSFSTINSTFQSNSISFSFTRVSTLAEFGSNVVKAINYSNFLGRTTGNKFYQSFSENVVNDGFDINVINCPTTKNNFGTAFKNNTINSFSTMQNNTFSSDVNTLNLSLATHIYQSYSCTIFRKPDGTYALSYINNANTQVIAAATA